MDNNSSDKKSKSASASAREVASIMLAQIGAEDFIEAVAARVVEKLADEPKAPELLTREALARALDVSVATVSRMRGEGMPCVLVLDSPRYRLADCLEWCESRSRANKTAEVTP